MTPVQWAKMRHDVTAVASYVGCDTPSNPEVFACSLLMYIPFLMHAISIAMSWTCFVWKMVQSYKNCASCWWQQLSTSKKSKRLPNKLTQPRQVYRCVDGSLPISQPRPKSADGVQTPNPGGTKASQLHQNGPAKRGKNQGKTRSSCIPWVGIEGPRSGKHETTSSWGCTASWFLIEKREWVNGKLQQATTECIWGFQKWSKRSAQLPPQLTCE